MHLDNRNFASVLIGVFVERNEAGFVRLDEVGKLGNTPPFVLELALLALVGGDEDEGPGHFDSSHLGLRRWSAETVFRALDRWLDAGFRWCKAPRRLDSNQEVR